MALAKAKRPAAELSAREPLADLLPGLISSRSKSSDPENQARLFATASSRAIVIGIDIGICGAVAIVTADGVLLDIVDTPTLQDGPAKRRSINAPLFSEIVARSHATKAYVEFVGARPGEGAVGAFSFGRARGVVEGVCAALGVSVTFISPASWKRHVGIKPGREGAKDAARSEAIRRWPDKAAWFARVRDDGRAEACLIAVAGLQREAAR
jgi:crossover junction endodeoxyribonuclease RuvC